MSNTKNKKKVVKAWAVWQKHKDIIMEVGFFDCGDFKPKKEMFTCEDGRPAWADSRYRLIPIEITYSL